MAVMRCAFRPNADYQTQRELLYGKVFAVLHGLPASDNRRRQSGDCVKARRKLNTWEGASDVTVYFGGVAAFANTTVLLLARNSELDLYDSNRLTAKCASRNVYAWFGLAASPHESVFYSAVKPATRRIEVTNAKRDRKKALASRGNSGIGLPKALADEGGYLYVTGRRKQELATDLDQPAVF